MKCESPVILELGLLNNTLITILQKMISNKWHFSATETFSSHLLTVRMPAALISFQKYICSPDLTIRSHKFSEQSGPSSRSICHTYICSLLRIHPSDEEGSETASWRGSQWKNPWSRWGTQRARVLRYKHSCSALQPCYCFLCSLFSCNLCLPFSASQWLS